MSVSAATDRQRQHKVAVGLLLLTAVLWSASGLGIKLTTWNALGFWGARNFFAFSTLLVWIRPKTVPKLLAAELVAGIALQLGQLLFIIANRLGPAANAIFLSYFQLVVIIPLGWIFLRERPKRGDWLALLVILAGMGFFFADDFSWAGAYANLFGLLTGCAFAVMTLALRMVPADRPPNSILFSMGLGAVIGLPFLAVETIDTTNLSVVLLLGIFQMGIPFILYTFALRRVPALQATILVTLEPILNPIWVFLALGELPGRYAFVGIGLVLLGVVGRAVSISAET